MKSGVRRTIASNVGWNGYQNEWFYAASVNYTGEAYWTDVLDIKGTTDAFTTVDASLGVMLMDGTCRGVDSRHEPVRRRCAAAYLR